MKIRVLKFKGEYGELKNHGYEFQKLYAGNYMQWCKRIGGEYSDTTIRVWKKGNCVEIGDNFECSGVIAEYIRDNDPNYDLGKHFGKKDMVWRVVVNKKTAEIEEYQRVRHNSTSYFLRDKFNAGKAEDECYQNMPEESKNAMTPNMSVNEFYDTYKTIIIGLDYGQAIRELFELELAELVEENFHEAGDK